MTHDRRPPVLVAGVGVREGVMGERKHHPDCPVRFFPDHPERCRCLFMAALDRFTGTDAGGRAEP